jgi:hypothetical protein
MGVTLTGFLLAQTKFSLHHADELLHIRAWHLVSIWLSLANQVGTSISKSTFSRQRCARGLLSVRKTNLENKRHSLLARRLCRLSCFWCTTVPVRSWSVGCGILIHFSFVDIMISSLFCFTWIFICSSSCSLYNSALRFSCNSLAFGSSTSKREPWLGDHPQI